MKGGRPVRSLNLSFPAFLASMALLFSACGDDTDAPSTSTGGGGAVSQAGQGGAASAGAATATGGTGGSTSGAATGGAGAAPGGSSGASGGVAGAGGVNGLAGSGGSVGGGNGGAAGSAGAGGSPGFQACPASGACKIMPFGDSITQGFDVAGGYRAPLLRLALAAGKEITFVGSASDYSVPSVEGVPFPKNHEGHGGYTIEGNNGIARFVGTSIPAYEPHIVTLMIGTNDINGNNNLPDAPNRLGKLLDAIFTRDPDVLVVLAQIVPTRNDGTNDAVEAYNSAMPNLVSTRVAKGQRLVLVDMYTAFTDVPNFKQAVLADNLHPNQAGYDLMADVWFEALSPHLP